MSVSRQYSQGKGEGYRRARHDEQQAGFPVRATLNESIQNNCYNRARRENRTTQELLTLYVLERWLARLAVSPHADTFVLKGGLLLLRKT